MSFHKDLQLSNSELLKNVECPICKAKGTLRFYQYSDIPALNQTTVCDTCGTSFSKLQINTEDEKIISGRVGGYWKRHQLLPMASACGDSEYEESDPYFEMLQEPIVIESNE